MLRRLPLTESLGVLPLRDKRSTTLSTVFRYKQRGFLGASDLNGLSDEVKASLETHDVSKQRLRKCMEIAFCKGLMSQQFMEIT